LRRAAFYRPRWEKPKKLPKVLKKQYSNNVRFDAVIVLGMHRSGTSALTRGLTTLGVELGKSIVGGDGYNQKGYFEDPEVVQINDIILEKLGSNWASLKFLGSKPLRELHFKEERIRAARWLKEMLSLGKPIGFKDPRLCRTLPFWQKVFEELGLCTGYLLIYRNPDEVAASIVSRGLGNTSIDYAKSLWCAYQVDALRHLKSQKWLAVKYDLMLRHPVRELERIAKFLGVALDPDSAGVAEYSNQFLDSSLRHHQARKGIRKRPKFHFMLVSMMELVSRTRNDFCQWAARAAAEQVFNKMKRDTAFSILENKATWAAYPSRPRFWKKLERSIRKRRKRWIGRIGFDRDWYLQEYPEVGPSGMDPLDHYIQHGIQEGRWKSKQQKGRALGNNSITKPKRGFWRRMEEGIRERRKWVQAIWGFDACWYLETNPDVKEAGVDPLQHYLKYGIQEGRRKSKKDHSASVKPPLSVPFDKYLPSVYAAWSPPADLSVMVVVPVYKGKEETQRCIRSLLRNTDDIPAEILVVIDESPDAELVGWLEEVAAEEKIKLIRNEKNLGFVASVNRGMAWAGRRDVILLNSDTEVPSGWMKRLAGHAYSAEKIGTVTPFSNNATICSWPTHQGGDLPEGRSVDEIDAAFREGNCRRQVTVPTGVGFCMYLRRTCLDEVGLFDEISFGRGYGEENDFCMRAHKAGWRHLLACDLFVAHVGQTSFGKNRPELAKAWETVCRLHPKYPHLIAKHIQTDEGSPYRFAATATLFRKAVEPTIMMVNHNWGGGTGRHVKELVKVMGRSANVLLLQGDPSGVRVSIPSLPGHPYVILGNHEVDKLHALLCSFGVNRVHIHHWIDLKINLKELIQKLKVPFDLTVHDYYSICPQITLTQQRNKAYCGEPDEKECDACIKETPHNGAILHGAKSIAEWRNDSRWVLNEAKRVICPTEDVKNRMARYAPQANFIVAHHENVADGMWRVANPKITQNQKVRIGLIGWLSPHKGWKNVVETVSKCDPEKYEFIHIGYSEPELPIQVRARIQQVGRYEEANLPHLIQEAGLHVAWFSAIWPETYSYTLSAAIEAALPIAAPKIGAFPERLAGRPMTWLLESYQSSDEWVKLFDNARELIILNPGINDEKRIFTNRLFYPEKYLQPLLKIKSGTKKSFSENQAKSKLDKKHKCPGKVHVFTSAAWNYLPKVRLLFQSIRKFHPEWDLHWVIADRMREGFDLGKEPFDEICELEDLGIPNWISWVFGHSLVELSTAIKPYMLAKLLKREDCEKVIYLDPDIVVFSKLNDIIDSLDEHHVVLTPHQAMPEKLLEGVIDQEICSLKHGIYNLGFLGVANTGIGNQFAKWWSERLYNFCRDDIPNGLFTDQRWCDLVPALFSGVGILRESRFNVSTWNITNREISLTESGEYSIDGKPLGFYHFTGFDSGAHRIMAAKNGKSNLALSRLIDWYQNTINCENENADKQVPWAFGCFSDGTPIAPEKRIVYRDRKDLQTAFPNPFDSETYLAWWGKNEKTI
jgi:GT2 family glycosyltransferase